MIRRLALNAFFILVVIANSFAFASADQKNKTHKTNDAQVKKAIIQESIDSYPGNCPCPYSTASNGSRCGRRSAYSRPGGYAPICYPGDITQDMIREWRENHSSR